MRSVIKNSIFGIFVRPGLGLTEKNVTFSENSFTCEKLLTEIIMKRFNYVVVEKSAFQHSTKSIFSPFSAYSDWKSRHSIQSKFKIFAIFGSWRNRIAAKRYWEAEKKVQLIVFFFYNIWENDWKQVPKNFGAVKIAFYVTKGTFWGKLFGRNHTFKSVSVFGLWAKKIRQGCQNCVLWVQGNVFE